MPSLAEREVLLDKEVTRIHALAGDNGHVLHVPWRFEDDLSANTACRACGAQAVVRVYGDGRLWRGGGLTIKGQRCPQEGAQRYAQRTR